MASIKKGMNNFGGFLFFFSVLLSFIMLCIITSQRISKSNNKPYVYYMSKIITIKNIVKTNHQSQLLYRFDSSGNMELLPTNYQSLLKVITKDGCAEGYRQCGILDTIGNILCIDETYDCPINKINLDLISKRNDYLNKGYSIGYYYPNLVYNYQLYCSNHFTNSTIIISLKRDNNKPKYFSRNNFILDENAYRDEYGNLVNSEEKEQMSQEDFSLIKYISNEYYEKFKQYIEERLQKEESNIDKYYEYVGEKVYIKNYIGFRTIEDIDKFMNFDYSIYKYKFPNRATSIVAIVFIFGEILYCIIVTCIKEKFCGIEKCLNSDLCSVIEKCLFPIFVLLFLGINLGMMIYSITIYYKVNKNTKLNELKKIESDEFINNFINEFVSLCQKSSLIISTIIMLSLSLFFHIISLCRI